MIGSRGERVLRATLPHVRYWNAWHVWNGNTPEGVAPLREQIDTACREVGRDPADVERTVAVAVRLPGGMGVDDPTAPAITGAPEEIAEKLRGFARAGVSHVQIVLDPNTCEGIEAFAPTLAMLDRG